MRTTTTWFTLLAALAIGCGGPDGRNNGGTDGGGGNGDGGGSNGDNCSDAAKLVYVVDTSNVLAKFDPPTKTFTNIGTLNCPADAGATPFSMGIDRTPTAWVLYNSGELFKVNVTTAACEATTWNGPTNLKLFGMGFSSDAVGGTADSLFVAGGPLTTTMGPTSNFAKLDTTTFTSGSLGSVTGWPELTGTGNAELWGFFPAASGPRIEKLNKATGGALQTFNVSSLAGDPLAWAFAAWGGDFWVFLEKDPETSTTVYQVDGATGTVKSTTAAGGREIVGAGVSTCAPTVIL